MANKRSGGRSKEADSGGREHHAEAASIWEWVVAAVGLVIVLAVAIFVGYRAFQQDAAVPQVALAVEGIEPVDQGFVVRFVARNHSGVTASQLNIRGELRRGGTVVETSVARLDYLPAQSQRHGGLHFQNDPRQHEIHLLARGYAEP